MNWGFYKITGIGSGISTTGKKYYQFKLNDSVVYRNGGASHISIVQGGYGGFSVGDTVQVQVDKLRSYNMNHVFNFSDMVLCFGSSHWEGKYWEAVRDKNNLRDNLTEQRDVWRKKYQETRAELEEKKEEARQFVAKLEEAYKESGKLRDEMIKMVMENAKDMLAQKAIETTLRVEQAKTDAQLKQLEDNEQKLNKLLQDKEAVNDLMKKQIDYLRDEFKDSQQENKGLLKEKLDEEEVKLASLATRLQIKFITLAEIQQTYDKWVDAKEKNDTNTVRDCQLEIAVGKDALLQQGFSFADVKEVFDQCEGVAGMQKKIDKIDKNIKDQSQAQQAQIQQAQQAVLAIKPN